MAVAPRAAEAQGPDAQVDNRPGWANGAAGGVRLRRVLRDVRPQQRQSRACQHTFNGEDSSLARRARFGDTDIRNIKRNRDQ